MADISFSTFGVAVNNVKNPQFGALGNGIANDTAAIQAAINDSFGTTVAPHGASAWLNKPLYFPHGMYLTNAPLTFPHVKGGQIFGDGCFSTQIINTATNGTVFVTNGFEGCRIERMLLATNGSGIGLDLDWDGTGAVGLKNNLIVHLQVGGGPTGYGARIANSGNGGSGNHFELCYIGGGTGIATMTAGAVCNSIVGGNMAGCAVAQVRMVAGSVTLIEGVGLQNPGNNSAFDFMIDAAVTDNIVISGGRTESSGIVKARGACSVVIQGYNQFGPGISDKFVDIAAPSKVCVDACSSVAGTMVGSSGTLYVRGGTFPAGYMGTFSGTVGQLI